jgi:hypothetical protein
LVRNMNEQSIMGFLTAKQTVVKKKRKKR